MKKPTTTPQRQARFVSVTGIVVPAGWDADGNPNVFAIATHDEKEFIIDRRNKAGKELPKFLRQKVKVTGILTGTGNIRNRLSVKSYVKLTDSPEDTHKSGAVDRVLALSVGAVVMTGAAFFQILGSGSLPM